MSKNTKHLSGGKRNKNGVNDAPKTPKPNIKPPKQKKENNDEKKHM